MLLPSPSLGLLPLDPNKGSAALGPPPTEEGPALTLSLATPSMGVESAGSKEHAPWCYPMLWKSSTPEFHAPAAPDPLMVSAQFLPRAHAHIPKGLQRGQRAAVCTEGMDRAWT